LWREEPSKATILHIAFARPSASLGACRFEFGLHLARVGGAHQRSERTTLDASVGATEARWVTIVSLRRPMRSVRVILN